MSPIFYIEAANALATNTYFTKDDILQGMKFLFGANFKEQNITQKIISEAASYAREYKTSVYDMLYAVIAKEKNTYLITANAKFIKRINLPYVLSLNG